MNPEDVQLRMSRPFGAGSFKFLVGTFDATSSEVVERLLADLPEPTNLEGKFECFVLARSGAGSAIDRWDLSGPVLMEMSSASLSAALTMLVTSINLAALGAEPERLHLHAAGIAKSGRAAIISAPRDTGKTTTLAHLVLRGWEYLSDEAVSLGPRDDEVRAFGKPLSVKPTGRHLVSELEPHFIPPSGQADTDILHVALGEAGAAVSSQAVPRLIVILRRDQGGSPDGTASVRDIHAADAVVSLMAETMDAERFGRLAVGELARLAARCRCVEMSIGTPEATADLIECLFSELGPDPLAIQELPDSERIDPEVVSILIGDRVVIHELGSGRILALDQMATLIWLTLVGWPCTEEIDLAGPVVAPFVDQLGAFGLLRSSGSGGNDGRAGS